MPSAGELGIFEALADSPASIDALAARTGLTQRDGISAGAMAALGLHIRPPRPQPPPTSATAA